MPDEFKPVGAIIVVPGVLINEHGKPVGDRVAIQFRDGCVPMERSREGLAQLQAVLLEAVKTLGDAMVTAPPLSEVTAEPPVPQILQATAMPALARMTPGTSRGRRCH